MDTNFNLTTKENCKIKVTSILDNNSKEFGGNYIIDGSDDTCWCSSQGQSQSIIFEFKKKPTFISDIDILIQGGFSPKSIEIYYYNNDPKKIENDIKLLDTIEVKDINDHQVFNIKKKIPEGVFCLKLYMNKFTDFFGRVTFYTININGY